MEAWNTHELLAKIQTGKVPKKVFHYLCGCGERVIIIQLYLSSYGSLSLSKPKNYF